MSEKPKYKFPKTMGECADKLFELRDLRMREQKKVDEIEAEEKALKNFIIDNLPKSNAAGITGKLARVTIVKKIIPQVSDWPKFYAYVKKTNQFELLQRRVSDAAVKERWDIGKEVPGVTHFNAVTVSINKV